MGADGGFKSKRKEVLKKVNKNMSNDERTRKKAATASFWTYCNLTGVALSKDIIISKFGHIYDKKNLFEAISEKRIPKKYNYVRKIKNLFEVDLCGANSFSEYTCPLSLKSPRSESCNAFALITICNHFFSKEELLELSDFVCPICHKKFEEKDLITLDPST